MIGGHFATTTKTHDDVAHEESPILTETLRMLINYWIRHCFVAVAVAFAN
jgi:hypothetical protein